MMRPTLLVTIALIGSASLCLAGGELPERPPMPTKERISAPEPDPGPAGNTIPRSKIGPPLGPCIERDQPLPPPSRPIGWGFNLHEFYGPTYYYPYKHNTYEGLNPTYYPFYHPRLWPNYKADGIYKQNSKCGGGPYWDSYDNWTRGGRYEEKQ